MISIPSPRRLLPLTLIILAITTFYKARPWASSKPRSDHLPLRDEPLTGIRVPIASLDPRFPRTSTTGESPWKELDTTDVKRSVDGHESGSLPTYSAWDQPHLHPHLQDLFGCPTQPNRITGHIRLPQVVRNISMTLRGSREDDDDDDDARDFWNPTVISLPYWSPAQYLVVARILTDGFHQQNVLCEAVACYVGSHEGRGEGEVPCTADDIERLGPAGGMRCVTAPLTLSVPPTPAEHCEGKFGGYVDIPGFHDPRIFWSGRGEPLMMVNTQSRYACFGLWVVDLRALYPPLGELLASSPTTPSLGPLMSFPHLTELTRNPARDRSAMEKNWMMFFDGDESYVQYEISPQHGRAFAKLVGGGFTTTNLTDPEEISCLAESSPPHDRPRWHQATNSLRLVLCDRSDPHCRPNTDNTVFFAIVHRKYSNSLRLPMRYERYVIVWAGASPFRMLGISQHPLLLANETASGWSAAENWDDDDDGDDDDGDDDEDHDPEALRRGRPHWAYFTYTVSIAYAWGRKGDEAMWKNTGFLDDDVVLSVGVDDEGQVFASVPARDLLQCLRACPGTRQDSGPKADGL